MKKHFKKRIKLMKGKKDDSLIIEGDFSNFRILGIGKLSEKQKQRRENNATSDILEPLEPKIITCRSCGAPYNYTNKCDYCGNLY